MKDMIYLGATPSLEPCEQIGENYRSIIALAETKRYIAQLKEQFGNPPKGAVLKTKQETHETGPASYEVVIVVDDDYQDAVDYAYRCENEAWRNWKTTETKVA